jgi:nucleoside-diphosphate-sugar epimerase
MKVLFIGGTGLISSACAEAALARGVELTILNRGRSAKYAVPRGAEFLAADVHGDETELAARLRGRDYDAVVDWIAYLPADVARDVRLFSGRTGQFVFISSASAYRKPRVDFPITEDSPLENPFWQYSRDKIACERALVEERAGSGFPYTIVRPSLTYGPSQIPLCVGSWNHPWTVIDRMLKGKGVIVPGDGTSLWTITWNADFAVGFVGLLGREDAVGEAFHITSDEALTWNEIYGETAAALGVAPRITHVPSDLIAEYEPESLGSLIGDKSNSAVFDNAKIKRFVPEFSCRVKWAEGVRMSLAWFRADPARMTIDDGANRTWEAILGGYARARP